MPKIPLKTKPINPNAGISNLLGPASANNANDDPIINDAMINATDI